MKLNESTIFQKMAFVMIMNDKNPKENTYQTMCRLEQLEFKNLTDDQVKKAEVEFSAMKMEELLESCIGGEDSQVEVSPEAGEVLRTIYSEIHK